MNWQYAQRGCASHRSGNIVFCLRESEGFGSIVRTDVESAQPSLVLQDCKDQHQAELVRVTTCVNGDSRLSPRAPLLMAGIVKSRVGPEMKQDLLLFSWSWRPGVAVDWLASRLVDVDCLNLAAVDVDAKGIEEWLDDRRTHGVAELCEETPWRGAIPVGARGGLDVNREIAGGSSVFS
ncbi:hypothetical protein Taro_055653, partial [Colocasia esculenta]|nr:hypothetical protein [Colocasia esculenta]